MPWACAYFNVSARGSNESGWLASAAALGSKPPLKYASPRPRTWTSSVLKRPDCADFTIAATAAGVVSEVRVTHSARTSGTGVFC